MTYQITYASPKEETKKLADAFLDMLPAGSILVPVAEADTSADVHLVGFELQRGCPRGIPENVAAFLKKLSHKTILVFATVPFEVSDMVRNDLCRFVMEVLPKECDYVGLYVCSSHPSKHLIGKLQNYIEEYPDNSRAKHWLDRCTGAAGRPNEMDIQKGCQFVSLVLKRYRDR